MMKKRKVVSLLLAVCMFVSIAFCGEITASAVSGSDVVNQARKYIGKPYGSWNGGFDCSQFVSRVFSDLGISLPTAVSEYRNNPTRYGTVVGNSLMANAVAGDVIAFPGHIEIYTGNGKSIGSRVSIDNNGNYVYSGGSAGVQERDVSSFRDTSGNFPDYMVIRINGVTDHTVNLDTEPPTIKNTFVSDISDTSFTINCDLNDNVGVTNVWLNIYGPSGEVGYRVSAGNGRFSYTIKTADHGGPGEYAVHIYPADAAGNSSGYAFETFMVKTAKSSIVAEPTQFSVLKGRNIEVALKITNAKNADSGTISVRYDPNKLEYITSSTENTKGSWNEVWLKRSGELYANFICSRPYDYDEFPLATLTFKVLEAGETNLLCQVADGDIDGIKIPDIATIKLEIDWEECTHKWDDGVVTKEATCTQKGEIVYTCSKCSEEKTEVLPALGHDYVGTFVAATCEEDAKTHYVCSRCGDAYDGEVRDEDKYSFSDWTTERPAAPENGEVEEQTQYKSRTKTVKTGDSVSDGWTKESERWIESGSGSVDFAVSWPGGFDRNSDLYRKYNVSRPEATETASTKRTVGAASKIGYLYWHWCRNYNGGPTNRFYSDEYYIDQDGSWTTFHAFFSNDEYEYRTFSGYDPAYVASNASVCRDTYYWTTSRVEIDRVDYTDYKKEYTYSKWSDWSDWQFDSAEPGENREVETRTVYRVKTIKDNILSTGAHQWNEGVVTLEPTQAAAGERTYTCKVCGAVKTEPIEPLPTTAAPTTAAPTTAAPTTAAPTTAAPTTAAPTTAAPTTAAPTTEEPMTATTTTEAPTTAAHTTVAPTATELPTTTEPPTTTEQPTKTGLLGDADNDGKVTAGDARRILRHAAKIELETDEFLLKLMDTDQSGSIKASDARLALRMASRLEPTARYDPSNVTARQQTV